MKTASRAFAAVALLAICSSCSAPSTPAKPGAAPNPPTGKPRVAVVNYPLKYFAERIAGDAVEIVFPVPSGEDPAFWQPDDEAIQGYQAADRILRNGAGYAQWMETVSLPEARIVDTSAAFKDAYLKIEAAVTHSHGPGGAHAHAGTDFNTWLDPQQAKAQARAVADALLALKPDAKTAFESNFEALAKDLDELDAAFRSAGNGKPTKLVASHPVYNYLARRCGWALKSMHWEPDTFPEEAEWQKLAEVLKAHPARFMLWEDTPLEQTVAKLKEMGVAVIVVRPCGNVPEEGDYLSVMRRSAQDLKAALNP